jgi:hypothetical protein
MAQKAFCYTRRIALDSLMESYDISTVWVDAVVRGQLWEDLHLILLKVETTIQRHTRRYGREEARYRRRLVCEDPHIINASKPCSIKVWELHRRPGALSLDESLKVKANFGMELAAQIKTGQLQDGIGFTDQ